LNSRIDYFGSLDYRQPVDRLKHPDYDKIIDTPMDLSIIREELKGDNYDSPHEFWKDLKIMFNNAKNFTPNKKSRVSAYFFVFCLYWYSSPINY